MYKLSLTHKYPKQIDYSDFGVRIRDLLNNDGKKKIVYVTNDFANATFRYRFFNFKQSLCNSEKYSAVCFTSAETPMILSYLPHISAVVLQRATLENDTNNFIFACKHHGLPLIYDIDDLIYNANCIIDYVTNIGLNPNVYNMALYFGIACGHTHVARHCDAFMTTTTYLRDHLVEDFGKKTYIIPNYFNKEQEICSKNAVDERVYDGSKYYIGYFSGSDSHQNDFGVCKEAVIRMMRKYSDVYLKIVGFMNLEGELAELKNEGRVIFKPVCSYEELQYEIAEVDINIAPLVNYYFNDCKSELKFFESALVKVPSAVSAVGVYKDIIKNGENGFLCRDTDWFDTLETAYLDRELTASITESAYKYATSHYHYDLFAPVIEQTFDEILEDHNK